MHEEYSMKDGKVMKCNNINSNYIVKIQGCAVVIPKEITKKKCKEIQLNSQQIKWYSKKKKSVNPIEIRKRRTQEQKPKGTNGEQLVILQYQIQPYQKLN